MAQKTRIVWLDNLKGVLIILVVMGHCLQFTLTDPDSSVLFNFIYSFHMPLFMCLSGFACYKADLKWSLVSKRFIQLMIPFLSFTALTAIISGRNYLDYILHPDLSLWFLWVFFFLTILQVLVLKCAKLLAIPSEILTLVLLTVSFILARKYDVSYFAINMIIYYWLYYALGFYLHKYSNMIERSDKYVIWSLLIIAGVLSLTFHRTSAPSFLPLGNISVYVRLVAVVVIMSVLPLFRTLKGNMLVISMLGGVSLGVYAIHLLFFISPDYLKLVDISSIFYYPYIILLTSLMIGLSYFAIWLIKKNKYTSLIFLGKPF